VEDVRSGGFAVVLALTAVTAPGCGGAATPSTRAPSVAPASAGAGPTSSPSGSVPGMRIRLRPEVGPPAQVQVDLEITFDGKAPEELVGVQVEPRHLLAGDDHGALPVTLRDATVRLSRPPVGALRLHYDVGAETTPSALPLATVVQEDRFRAAGERLLLVPTTPLYAARPRAPVDVQIDIDGSALKLARAASTMGLGLSETRSIRPEGLLHTTFIGGSLYSAEFDAEARDQAAWLGYTAFDPRPASAELAQIRTAIGEFFRSELPPFTTLIVSQARPLGSFSTHLRSGGVLVLVGPAQPWDAALRLSITEQIVHGWIGGEIRLAAANETEARANAWFTDGVTRFVAMRFLARLGLLSADDVGTIVAGEMSALTTSPHRGASAATLASDPRPTARAELTARGALAALRIHRLLRERSKGARSFDDLLLALAAKAKAAGGPLPVTAFRELLEAELGPAELATFSSTVQDGRPLTLPPRALGPCFRDGTAEYVAFDLGFDEAQTLATTPHAMRGLRLDGPAARAGVRADDELVALDEPSGKNVVVTVRRGSKDEEIRYRPEGSRARGPSWSRIEGMPVAKCGDVP
jgi:hypothetical protein